MRNHRSSRDIINTSLFNVDNRASEMPWLDTKVNRTIELVQNLNYNVVTLEKTLTTFNYYRKYTKSLDRNIHCRTIYCNGIEVSAYSDHYIWAVHATLHYYKKLKTLQG